MGLTKLAIGLAVKLKKLEAYETYLFIGPHPDDIEIGAGATIAKLVSLGKRVVFLICTDGRFGKENCPNIASEELAEIRREESLASAKLLGVEEVFFLDLCDGNGYDYDDLLCGIANAIQAIKPDVVLCPDPDTISETHADHLNVGRATKELANFANYPEIFDRYLGYPSDHICVEAIAFYMTAKPNVYVSVKRKFVKKQKEAIMAHSSQYPKESEALSSLLLYLKLRRIEFGFKTLKGSSEGFRVLDRTRMHCLPEAGI